MANRVMLGALDSGGYGLRVSRPGFDVTDPATVDKKLAFDSRWPAALNLVASGTGSLSSSSSTAISFGVTLPAIPLLFVAQKVSGSYYGFLLDSITRWNNTFYHDQITTTGATISSVASIIVPFGSSTPFAWYAFLT